MMDSDGKKRTKERITCSSLVLFFAINTLNRMRGDNNFIIAIRRISEADIARGNNSNFRPGAIIINQARYR